MPFTTAFPRRRSTIALSALLIANFSLGSGCSEPAAPLKGVVRPELKFSRSASPQYVEGSYMIMLRDAADVDAVLAEHGIKPKVRYRKLLKGFAAAMSENAREKLARDPRVAIVEREGIAHIAGVQTLGPGMWGLDRIDQKSLPLSGTYNYPLTGSGVVIYMFDTGIRTTHTDFGGRAFSGFDMIDGGAADDCNGHGTHVSATAAGTTYGVAKQAWIYMIRVVDCGGSAPYSGLVEAMDAIATSHPRNLRGVANISLVGPASATVDSAVGRMVASGIPVVVAAGNEAGKDYPGAGDACLQTPARAPSALTVAATDTTDSRAWFSSYGACVDIFAPGQDVKSADHSSDTGTRMWSGTSMSAPHVTGVVAMILEYFPKATPAEVEWILDYLAVKDAVADARSAKNRLLSLAGAE